MKLANAPWLQLLENHPLTTIVGCSACLLLALGVGCWCTGRAKRRGESTSITVMLMVAIGCALAGYVAGFISSHQLQRQRDFAKADVQYLELDSERAELYDTAMDFIGRVDGLDAHADRLSPTPAVDKEIQQLLQTCHGLANELGTLQEEAEQQHARAKQIRAQYRELSIVVHTDKMLAELDQQAMRLQQVETQLQQLLTSSD